MKNHNWWFVFCLGFLVLCAIPGGMSIMWGVPVCILCAGLCFWRWMNLEDKHQREEHEKYLERKNLTK